MPSCTASPSVNTSARAGVARYTTKSESSEPFRRAFISKSLGLEGGHRFGEAMTGNLPRAAMTAAGTNGMRKCGWLGYGRTQRDGNSGIVEAVVVGCARRFKGTPGGLVDREGQDRADPSAEAAMLAVIRACCGGPAFMLARAVADA